MGWEVFEREDSSQGSDVAFVSIHSVHFAFNSMFVRVAQIGNAKQVTIHVDSVNRNLGFEFHDDKRSTAFAISPYGSGDKRTTLSCRSVQLVRRYAWIRGVTKLPRKDRRFTPAKEGKLWVIHLCPAFEDQRARESADIPSGVRGIYRYVRESGEIVYIGRGDIKKRLASPERADWDFDKVEFSAVQDPDQQVKWEDYWLTRYREENGGRLPFYNKVSGISSKGDDERDEDAAES